jgi:hypothetical protein
MPKREPYASLLLGLAADIRRVMQNLSRIGSRIYVLFKGKMNKREIDRTPFRKLQEL